MFGEEAAGLGFVTPTRVSLGQLQEALTWSYRAQRSPSPGLDPQEWLSVPLMDKSSLRETPRHYPDTGEWLATLLSSGTTGQPVASPWSEADEKVASSTMRSVHSQCPPIANARCGIIVPDSRFAVAYFMRREVELCGATPIMIAPSAPDQLCRSLEESHVDVVFTLPLVASRLGEYFNHRLGGVPERIGQLFCGGDILSSARHRLLEQLWQAKVTNVFGCSELFGPIAISTSASKPFEWHCPDVAVEVLDESTKLPVEEGQVGVLVYTSLWPKARPLVRYWSGDYVRRVFGVEDDESFRFDYIGRSVSTFANGSDRIPLSTIDETLISSGFASSEWCIDLEDGVAVITAETFSPSRSLASDLEGKLFEDVGLVCTVRPARLGSLGRQSPKFIT